MCLRKITGGAGFGTPSDGDAGAEPVLEEEEQSVQAALRAWYFSKYPFYKRTASGPEGSRLQIPAHLQDESRLCRKFFFVLEVRFFINK